MPLERSLIRPISPEEQAARSWRVTIDDREVATVASVEIVSDDFGILAYGQTPAGHDGWSFRESRGGGAVILPYVWYAGDLWVGLLLQDRPNQGGAVLNAPRGFVGPDESHAAGAAREFAEEMAIPSGPGRLLALHGEPANPNSSFFETLGDSGVRFYAMQLLSEEIEATPDGPRIRTDRIYGTDGDIDAQRERIHGALLVPWWQAATVADMFTNAGVARLYAHLHRIPGAMPAR